MKVSYSELIKPVLYQFVVTHLHGLALKSWPNRNYKATATGRQLFFESLAFKSEQISQSKSSLSCYSKLSFHYDFVSLFTNFLRITFTRQSNLFFESAFRRSWTRLFVRNKTAASLEATAPLVYCLTDLGYRNEVFCCCHVIAVCRHFITWNLFTWLLITDIYH